MRNVVRRPTEYVEQGRAVRALGPAGYSLFPVPYSLQLEGTP